MSLVRGRRFFLAALILVVVMACSLTLATGKATGSAATVEMPSDIIFRMRPHLLQSQIDGVLSALPGQITPLAPPLGIYRLQTAAGLQSTLDTIRRTAQIAYAEPNYAIHIDTTPNDPDFFTRQWALTTIDAPGAWDIVTGSEDITIAIIDTGIDLNHPDLVNKLVAGASFVSGVISAQDDHGHGTHVAGIAAASANNGVGIAGVSWGARLMPVKVLDANGGGTYAQLISGIYYAASRGANIINMSLSSDSYSQALQDAIDYAYEQGVILVAAAGNCGNGGQGCNGVNPILYPAANNHVFSVAATNRLDQRADFSTYNQYVDIAAPGVSVFSTFWQDGESAYTEMTGTSQAAPHVSGLAALIWSGRSWLNNAEIETIIKNTARDVNALSFPGADDYLGSGRIDARRANDRTPPWSTIQPLPASQRDPSFLVSWSGDDDNSGLRWYDVQYRRDNGQWQDWLVQTSATQSLFSGERGHTYYFQASATDWAGNAEFYPGGDGDTHITLTACTIGGQVMDNRGVAVAAARVTVSPSGNSTLTDEFGQYIVSPDYCDSVYSISVARDGFGSASPLMWLAFTTGATITKADVYLPPKDNLLTDRNWDFEAGSLTPAWTTGGNIAPSLAAGQGHSGNYAAFLGTALDSAGPGGESSLATTITVPISKPMTLSFLYRIVTKDNYAHDYFEVRVNGQAMLRDSYAGSDYGTTHDLGWRHGSIDLTQFAGQQVQISLVAVQGLGYASYPTGVFIDEVSAGSVIGGPYNLSLPMIVTGG